MQLCVLLTFILGVSASAQAQNAKQTLRFQGTVINKEGDPIPGATVVIKGSKLGTTTDMQGEYDFTVTSKLPVTLIIQSIGYKTQELRVTQNTKLVPRTLTLDDDSYSLNDVVVVGYGESSRAKLTGAVSKVKGTMVSSITQDAPVLALQGTAAGVYVEQGSGVPGGGASSILVRGKGTLSSQSTPLYIIDGVPYANTPENPVGYNSTGVFGLANALSLIDPNDIESIEILKDADATAIYGTRGSNGVVLITTKKGQAGRVKVNLNMNGTAQWVGKRLDYLSTEEYLELRRNAFASDLARGYVTQEDYTEGNYPDLLLWDQLKDYDWQDLILGKTAWAKDIQLTVSGGNNNVSFLVGGSYYNSNTVVLGDNQYTRWSGKANVQYNSTDRRGHIEAGVNITRLDESTDNANNLYSYLNTAPNTPPYDDEGRPYYIPDNTDYTAVLRSTAYSGNNEVTNVIANMNASYKLWRTLTAKVNFGYTYSSSVQNNLYERYYYNPYDATNYNLAYYYTLNTSTVVVEPQLTYDLNVLGGQLKALLGATYEYANTKSTNISGKNYPDDLFLKDMSAAASITRHYNDETQTKSAAVFARLNYDYKSRYLLNTVFRRDGSSRFGSNNRWGNFYSIGAGWLFANENFIKESAVGKWLNYGKLRFSVGRTGNDGISDYAYMTKYSTSTYPYEGNIGITPTNLANENLHWEVTDKIDVGFELGLFDNRILLNANWYRNRSSDLLTRLYLPSQVGFSYITSNLDAKIDNKGWEFELNTTNIKTKNFSWNTSFNITIPKNVLVSYPGLESSAYKTTYVVGQSINVIRGYKYTGVDPETGVGTVEDVNSDGVINNTEDYQVLGNKDPKFYGGLSNTFHYKGFTLDISFYFRKKPMQTGYLWRYYNPIGFMYNVTREMADNYWKQPGDNAKYPALTTVTSGDIYKSYFNYLSYSDFAYSDASYIRLQNVRLAYDFPTKWISTLGLSNLQLYVQGKNLFTITNYDSYDPEAGDVSVPALTSFTFGLNVTF